MNKSVERIELVSTFSGEGICKIEETLLGSTSTSYGVIQCPRTLEEEEIGLYAAHLRTIVFQLRDAGHPLEDLYQAF
ncbi:hypothetical protein TNCV_3921091 [Trichonephila clavipes]|nr:hypothetical protein TNCV_3921091 [Trichonephila clavipes]